MFRIEYLESLGRRDFIGVEQPVVRRYLKVVCTANNPIDAAVQIVAAAPGGEIKGRDVLQSASYLLEVAQVGYGFKFGCEFCSPFSEELELSIGHAKALREIELINTITDWGVTNTTYKSNIPYQGNGGADDDYQIIVTKATQCVPKQLHLATAAAYFHKIEVADPWDEVKVLKTFDHENGTFEKSQELYEELRLMPALANLPEIPISTKLAA